MTALPAPFDSFFGTVVPFLVMLAIIVFVHEFGHFIVARWCGVKVDIFSLGFGKEIWGRTDRLGTRWKISALPLGGYVKFEGDMNPASIPDPGKPITPTSFNGKALWQKAAVVAAGPIANFVLAIAVFAGILMTVGELQIPPRIDGFVENGAAKAAGLEVGDLVRKVDGSPTPNFQDLQNVIFFGGGAPVTLQVERSGKLIDINITPQVREESDGFGGTIHRGLLGISHDATKDDLVYLRYGPVDAVAKGGKQTWMIVKTTVIYVGRLFSGQESSKQISGPGMIAAGAGSAAKSGLTNFLTYLAFVSVSIGLVNLFPVPILDGGHLVFYALEAIRGKPLGPNAMEWAVRIGLSFVLLLLFVGTFNDVIRWLVLHGTGS